MIIFALFLLLQSNSKRSSITSKLTNTSPISRSHPTTNLDRYYSDSDSQSNKNSSHDSDFPPQIEAADIRA